MTTTLQMESFNLHYQQLDWITQQAAAQSISKSEVVRRLLRQAMKPSKLSFTRYSFRRMLLIAIEQELAAQEPNGRGILSSELHSFVERVLKPIEDNPPA